MYVSSHSFTESKHKTLKNNTFKFQGHTSTDCRNVYINQLVYEGTDVQRPCRPKVASDQSCKKRAFERCMRGNILVTCGRCPKTGGLGYKICADIEQYYFQFKSTVFFLLLLITFYYFKSLWKISFVCNEYFNHNAWKFKLKTLAR